MKHLIIKIYCLFLELKAILINEIIAKRFLPPKIYDYNEIIDKIVHNGWSMSRFGDGEFGLIKGNSIMFQQYNEKMATELLEVLNCEREGILVCIPKVFDELDEFVPRAAEYWKKYLRNNRYSWYKILGVIGRQGRSKIYYDALISRFYVDYIDKKYISKKVQDIRKIWNGKRLLIIEGEKSRLGIGNDFFDNAAGIIRIIGPSLNAYNKIDEIEAAALQRNDYDMILIALGPTATVLAYRLWKAGKQALDVGHIDIEYEWYLQGAQEKVAVKDKFMAEVQGGDDIGDLHSEIYESQIVGRFM